MSKLSFFVARRYLFSKKSNNVINIISGISVVGITVCTAALVIVLSAFNGIEELVVNMANQFEPDVEITFKKSKTFNHQLIDKEKIEAVEGVKNCSEMIEEVVMIKKRDHWVNATLRGVENDFLELIGADKNIEEGRHFLEDEQGYLAVMGLRLMDKLGVFVPEFSDYQSVQIYFPVRDKKFKINDMPLNQISIPVGGGLRLNNESDSRHIYVNKKLATANFEYDDDITKMAVFIEDGKDFDKIAGEIRKITGKDFDVKTVYQKNEIIYKTSRTEKWMVIFILGFIFLLALFNMVASTIMLMLEKKKDTYILKSMGTSKADIKKIFTYNGLMINFMGLVIGLILGYIICLLQQHIGLLKMDGFIQEFFPVVVKLSDLLLITLMVVLLGGAASYFPIKILGKRVL